MNEHKDLRQQALNSLNDKFQTILAWLRDRPHLIGQGPIVHIDASIVCPLDGRVKLRVQITGWGDEQTRRWVANWARALGKTKKDICPTGDGADSYFTLYGDIMGVPVEVWTYQSQVCTRRVVGTRVVQRQIPASFQTRDVEVEDVEWDCEPILRGHAEGDAP